MSDTVKVAQPEGKSVLAIDYEITLVSGKEIQFTVRPDLGDGAVKAENGDLFVKLARTGHEVTIHAAHVAVSSRRERQMVLPAEKFEPEVKKNPSGARVIPIR